MLNTLSEMRYYEAVVENRGYVVFVVFSKGLSRIVEYDEEVEPNASWKHGKLRLKTALSSSRCGTFARRPEISTLKSRSSVSPTYSTIAFSIGLKIALDQLSFSRDKNQEATMANCPQKSKKKTVKRYKK